MAGNDVRVCPVPHRRRLPRLRPGGGQISGGPAAAPREPGHLRGQQRERVRADLVQGLAAAQGLLQGGLPQALHPDRLRRRQGGRSDGRPRPRLGGLLALQRGAVGGALREAVEEREPVGVRGRALLRLRARLRELPPVPAAAVRERARLHELARLYPPGGPDRPGGLVPGKRLLSVPYAPPERQQGDSEDDAPALPHPRRQRLRPPRPPGGAVGPPSQPAHGLPAGGAAAAGHAALLPADAVRRVPVPLAGAAGAVLRDVHLPLAPPQIHPERAHHGGALLAAQRHLARTQLELDGVRRALASDPLQRAADVRAAAALLLQGPQRFCAHAHHLRPDGGGAGIPGHLPARLGSR
mmetsp:Transcript_29005/g.63452  ORF Transcript_29005/g.63452 Transcript_29005/m.63452 type:complete len:354 (-) Transcript_29005:1063-2124(-)